MIFLNELYVLIWEFIDFNTKLNYLLINKYFHNLLIDYYKKKCSKLINDLKHFQKNFRSCVSSSKKKSKFEIIDNNKVKFTRACVYSEPFIFIINKFDKISDDPYLDLPRMWKNGKLIEKYGRKRYKDQYNDYDRYKINGYDRYKLNGLSVYCDLENTKIIESYSSYFQFRCFYSRKKSNKIDKLK